METKKMTDKKLNKKKKILIVILSILTVFILLCGALTYWQRINIEAFLLARKYSSDEIVKQMAENDTTLKKEIEKHFSEGLRDFTPEEQALIDSGKVSEKQMLAKIIAEQTNGEIPPELKELLNREIYEKLFSAQKRANNKDVKIKFEESPILVPVPVSEAKKTEKENTENEKTLVVVGTPTTVTQSMAPNTSNQTCEAIIAKYVAQLYALESKYIGAIEGVVASAKAEAKAHGLTKKDTSKLLSIGAKYTGTINSLEAQCDGEVEGVITNLTSELNAINADTSIIATIRSAYSSEKSLKRAYYMNKIGI